MIESTLTIVSLLMIMQSIFTIFGMIYAWNDNENIVDNKSPTKFTDPYHSFTVLLPAWQEEEVIADTIQAVSDLNYPDELKEILVLLRPQDPETIAVAERKIKELNKENIRLILVDDKPQNKSNQLNHGLKVATGQIMTVFDAEDQPHRDILNVVNTTMINRNLDVVQCGVQLMNFRSNWFATLNVLEYYFWFKSVLLMFSKVGIMPLGGNTVFVRKDYMKSVGGWDETCLTEDAALGISLSLRGAKMAVIYDEIHATQEEVPHDTVSFIKQRTRWNQGFMQILMRGEYFKLRSLKKIALILYVLIWPQVQTLFFLYLLLAITVFPFLKLNVMTSMITIFPVYLLILQWVLLAVGLYEFSKSYSKKYPWYMPIKIVATFFPYQVVMGICSVRALYRNLMKNNAWEKTKHINAHRQEEAEEIKVKTGEAIKLRPVN